MSAVICYSSPLNRSWDFADDNYTNGSRICECNLLIGYCGHNMHTVHVDLFLKNCVSVLNVLEAKNLSKFRFRNQNTIFDGQYCLMIMMMNYSINK